VLPVLVPGLVAAYVGAVLFGGTFMGIVALTMGLGQQLAPQHSARVLGLLTAAYGTGQIIGPLLAGLMAAHTDSFTLPLVGAAAIVAAGGVLLVVGSGRRIKYQTIAMKG
jgi:MFS family permease